MAVFPYIVDMYVSPMDRSEYLNDIMKYMQLHLKKEYTIDWGVGCYIDNDLPVHDKLVYTFHFTELETATMFRLKFSK